jgi:hypothetical protein
VTTRALRSHSPEARLAILRNRVVAAAWLLVITGAFTALEPFTGIYSSSGVSLGLLTPSVLISLLRLPAGGLAHIVTAAAAGALLIVFGARTSVTRRTPAAAAAVVLALDLALVTGSNGRDAFASFPAIVTVAVRLTVLYYAVGAVRAAGLRAPLAERMAAEDAAYQAERDRHAGTSAPGKTARAEEDEVQG